MSAIRMSPTPRVLRSLATAPFYSALTLSLCRRPDFLHTCSESFS